MKIPKIARYNNVVLEAYDFIIKNINEFPIPIFELIRKLKWGIISYSDLAQKQNCKLEDICECFGEDGYSIFNGRNYCIAYNNTKPIKRINFTLLHEIGHIVLNHHKELNQNTILKDNLSKEEYKILENEANCFARNVLAPAPLVLKISPILGYRYLTNAFGISFVANNTRISLLSNDLKYLTDIQIRNMQTQYNHYLYCEICGKNFINKDYRYCSTCGNLNLKKGSGFMRYADGINLDNSSKAKECPICKNEELENGEYCKICGTYVINKCAAKDLDINGIEYFTCNTLAEGNARYCVKCGHETTFFENGLLKKWDEETETDIVGEDFNLPF